MEKKLIKLSKSCIGQEEISAVNIVLKKSFLGMGDEVREFENLLSKYFGRDVTCVNSGTAALHLGLSACDIGPGDEVLVPSLTYLASFQAISATGAKPVSCDVDSESLCLSVKDLEQKINKKSKAIMIVHYSGGVGNIDEIYKFAYKNKIRVIEDAAHAFGGKYKNKLIGSFGDIVCFSFDGIKNITSGEGGCVVTNDKKVSDRVKDMRLLGVQKDTDNRYQGKRSWEFEVKEQGWRYHMSNIMAAIGIAQFNRKDELFNKRKNLAKQYDLLLKNIKDIKTLKNDYNEIVPHIYVIRINGLKNREDLRTELRQNSIETGKHYLPNHYLDFYKDKNILPNTEKVWNELLTLPLHPELDEEDIKYICKVLIKIINKYKN